MSLVWCHTYQISHIFNEKMLGNNHPWMSFEADRTEILGNLMLGYANVLDLPSTLDLSKLLGSGGHHPVVLRALEQNCRFAANTRNLLC